MLNSKIKRGYKDIETIIHTDQGTVYFSVSFNNIFNSYSVIMYIDFVINNYNIVQEFMDDVVYNNNNYRSSYIFQYKTPIEYRT